jgi:hypothetical protein
MPTATPAEAPTKPGLRAPAIGLALTLVLIALAALVPAVTGWEVRADDLAPLHATWDVRLGVGTVPALLFAVLATTQAMAHAATLAWGRLLGATWASGVVWMLSLAFVDGKAGVGTVLGTSREYLETARATNDLPHTLDIYVSRIPLHAPDNWPIHIAGHPPGALTFFVLLDRIGLGSGFAAGMVVTLIAATTALAVLITVRNLGAESLARRAAPFLVFGPAAVWQCVSADAMFAAVAAWGLAALSYAAIRPGIRAMAGWSAVAGLLLGYAVMLSYGLPLLGILAVTVLVIARSWRPLAVAAVAAASVLLAYAAFGFYWWDAVGVLRQRYWDGIAHVRPGWYWIFGNLAALALSAGPLVGAGVAMTIRRRREVTANSELRVITWLVAAAVTTIIAADASQMSRAEVERIWLPFVPWLLLGCALLPEKWRRRGLVLQLCTALLIQHLLHTEW